jgi:putative DNA primase/helicase
VCIRVGQALHHESGGSAEGLAMFDAWCATCDEKWALGWAADKWTSFRGTGITGGTIFALAEQRGWRKSERTQRKQRKKANGANGDDSNYHNGHQAAPDAPIPLVPVIQIAPGRLSQIATDAEGHLVTAGVPFFQRGSQLVRPVIEEVSASDDRKTTTAALVAVSECYMRDQLCRTIKWEKFVRREKSGYRPTRPRMSRRPSWHVPANGGSHPSTG